MRKQPIFRTAFGLQIIPLLISILVITVCLASCTPKTEKNIQSSAESTDSVRTGDIQNDSLDKMVDILLDVSAKDFFNHKPPIPVGFRNVQLKYLIKANQERVYLICGQFLARDKQDKDEWTDFAAIKTSDYEQWIGSNASGYCQDSKVISYKIKDLSSALKSRFDSLPNAVK